MTSQIIMTTTTTTASNSLKYWKQNNVFFVPPEEGAAEQPALVFKSLTELQYAMNELEMGMPEDDPLRQTVQPSSEAEDSLLKMQILGLMLSGTPGRECLVWLDRSHSPRVEWMGERPRTTLKTGFNQWMTHLLEIHGNHVPHFVQAMHWIFMKQLESWKASGTTQTKAVVSVVNEDTPASAAPTATDTLNHVTEKRVVSTADPVPMETAEATQPSVAEASQSLVAVERSVEKAVTSEEVSASKGITMQVEKAAEETTTTVKSPMSVEEPNGGTTTMPEAAMETETLLGEKTSDQAEASAKPSSEDMEIEDAPVEYKTTKSQQTSGSDSQLDVTEDSVDNTTSNQGGRENPAPPRVSLEPTMRPRRNRIVPPPMPEIAKQDLDEEFRRVDEKVIRKILGKAGFGLITGKFALPNSHESFSTMKEMQDDLRRNGIPNFSDWSPEERLELEKWVRESIYRTGKFPDSLSKNVEVSNYKDLMKLGGFKHKSTGLSTSLYVYPHVSDGQATQNHEFCFTQENDMMESLARTGLPEYLYENKDDETLLAMESYTDTAVYLKRSRKRNLFTRAWNSPETPKKRRRDGGSDGPDTASVSSASLKKPRGTPSKSKTSKFKKSNQVTPNKSKKPSPSKSRTRAVEEPSTPATALTEVTVEASVDMLPWPPAMDTVEEIEGATDRERMEKAHRALRETPDKPVFAGDSSLSENLKRIQDTVHAVIRSTGRHGGQLQDGTVSDSKALYVCGVPGTGKTLSISWICKHVLKLQETGKIGVERDADDEDVEWRFLLLNANRAQSADTFRGNMANEMVRYSKRRTRTILYGSRCIPYCTSRQHSIKNTVYHHTPNLQLMSTGHVCFLNSHRVILARPLSAGADRTCCGRCARATWTEKLKQDGMYSHHDIQ